MGVREIHIAGRTLAIHERDDTHDPATGRALTGSWLWDSALHLAEWMASESCPLDLAGKAVLELGAGTGLPGLAAAALGASRVALTDVAPLLPGLQANAEANGLGDLVEVRQLRWGKKDEPPVPSWLRDGPAWDLVLMSDVFYDPESMEGLSRVLKAAWGENTRGWAASEVRLSAAECVEQLRREGFEVVETAEKRRQLTKAAEESAVFAVYLIDLARGDKVNQTHS